MTHEPSIVFDYSSPSNKESLEQRTDKFNQVLSDMSRGEGMMEDDIESLCKFYNVPHPYE